MIATPKLFGKFVFDRGYGTGRLRRVNKWHLQNVLRATLYTKDVEAFGQILKDGTTTYDLNKAIVSYIQLHFKNGDSVFFTPSGEPEILQLAGPRGTLPGVYNYQLCDTRHPQLLESWPSVSRRKPK